MLALLESGTRRLVRTVDAMSDEQWATPSLLPGWSRTHVVAHLTLNAESLAAVLEGVREGVAVPMYPSQAARDAGIATLAAAAPSQLRDRFLGSTTLVGEAVHELTDDLVGTVVERVPGGRTFTAGDVGPMRVREVEIHHADLGLDYTSADWPVAFAALTLASRAAVHAGAPFTAYAVDLGQEFPFGEGGPTISGSAAALAWWATGRGSGDGLSSDDGRVPGVEAW